MSKKKSRKRVIKTIVPKVATVFDCPFCESKQSVYAKMKQMKAIIKCKVCSEKYEVKTNKLTEPIDVYHKWIDEAEKINNKAELGGYSNEE